MREADSVVEAEPVNEADLVEEYDGEIFDELDADELALPLAVVEALIVELVLAVRLPELLLLGDSLTLCDAETESDPLKELEAEADSVKLADSLADSDREALLLELAEALSLELVLGDDVALCELDADKLELPLAVVEALIDELVLADGLRE